MPEEKSTLAETPGRWLGDICKRAKLHYAALLATDSDSEPSKLNLLSATSRATVNRHFCARSDSACAMMVCWAPEAQRSDP